MEYYINNLGGDGPSLYHHGVKGMKWGVRKKPVSSGVKQSKKLFSKKSPQPAVKKAFSGDKKDISKATDEELNAYLKRMQLEKQVLAMQKEMTALTTPPKKVSAGKRFVKSVWNDMAYPAIKNGVADAGKEFVKSTVSDMLKKAAQKRAASR